MFHSIIIVSILSLTAGLARAQESTSSFTRRLPAELQFSDAGMSNPKEESLGKTLETGTAAERLAAARELWEGRSFRYSPAVLKFISDDRPGIAGKLDFKMLVENDLKPDSFLKEMTKGDYVWGAPLAFLRPNPGLVPELLADLDKPALRRYRPVTILALGKSQDRWVLETLLNLADSSEYRTAGDAAQALGYMNVPEVESKLIGALSRDNGWLQVQASAALGKMGTRKAIPGLTKLAEFKGYSGAINISGVAKFAIEQIMEREDAAANPPVPKK